MVQNERIYCDLLINEIIDIYKETNEWLGLQNKAIDRKSFSDVPKHKLEQFCKILKEVLADWGWGNQSLVHKGTLFHYFMVYYSGEGKVDFNSLKYLMDLTMAVIDSPETTILNLTQNLETLRHCFKCLNYAVEESLVVEESMIKKYLMMKNKNGNTLLHEWAKKGNYMFLFRFNCFKCLPYSRDF